VGCFTRKWESFRRCKNKTSIDRPYVNEVDYNGFSIGTRFSTSPRASYSLSHFRGTVDSVK